MVGGESRKSRSPLAVTEFKTPCNSRRVFSRGKSTVTSKNTSLKGLTSFTTRNVSNNMTSEDKKASPPAQMRITSSEKTGDVIVENASRTMVRWADLKLVAQPPTSRDRRALSCDRSILGDEVESTPVHYQLESINRSVLSYSPSESESSVA